MPMPPCTGMDDLAPYRESNGAETREVRANVTTPPRRLRLEKKGRTISLSFSGADGTMVPAGKIQLDLTTPFYVGLGVCAHNDSQLESAVFSNVVLEHSGAPAGKPATELKSTKSCAGVPTPNSVGTPAGGRGKMRLVAGFFFFFFFFFF